jgi:nucleotide-binding universal stress UspA family protein
VVRHAPCPVHVIRPTDAPPADGARDLEDKTILVPVDFSACSLEGLVYAIAFARKTDAKIIVQHVVDFGPIYLPDHYGIYDLSKYQELARKNAKDQIREFIKLADFGSVQFETVVCAGPAVWEICRLAEKRKTDLIITSTHGRTGLKHVLIGSTAECVVRQAPCGVLVIPSHPEIRTGHLVRAKSNVLLSKPKLPTSPGCAVETERLTRKYRKQVAHPLPERRATNNFRESHAIR